MKYSKQEIIDMINERVRRVNRETKPIFVDGDEDDIIVEIECCRAVYKWAIEEGAKSAKARNLKRLKEYGESNQKPQPKLVDNHKAKSKGKRPKTRDERESEALKRLGLNPLDFMKTLKG